MLEVFKKTCFLGAYDYQYILSDHQGNTRRVLSSLPEIYTTIGTMETGEDNGFTNINRYTSTTHNTTSGGNEVALLQAGNTGALVLLRMDKGDEIDLQVNGNYESAPATNTFGSTALGTLWGAFDGSFGANAEGGSVVANPPSNFDDVFATGTTMRVNPEMERFPEHT